MKKNELVMTFDMSVINHLGVHLYSTLPPVISELIANTYDADANIVTIKLFDNDQENKKIVITDDGIGLTFDEINTDYLVVGRNRRLEKSEITDLDRLVIGKKGIGKLAAFGISELITIETNKNGLKNRFILSYDDMKSSDNGIYKPVIDLMNKPTKDKGTIITLENIKRKSKFDWESLKNKLSKFFSVFNAEFVVSIYHNDVFKHSMSTEDRYSNTDIQFEWRYPDDFVNLKGYDSLTEYPFHNDVTGYIATKRTPLKPSDGKPGFILYARSKMVQDSMFFSNRSTDQFHSYCFGDFTINFIEVKSHQDLISTDRLSLTWDVESAEDIRSFFIKIEKIVQREWRDKRSQTFKDNVKSKFNTNFKDVIAKISPDEREFIEKIGAKLNFYDSDSDTTDLFLDEVKKKVSYSYYDNVAKDINSFSSTDIVEVLKIVDNLKDNETSLIKRTAFGRLTIIRKLLDIIDDDSFSFELFCKTFKTMPWLFSTNIMNEYKDDDMLHIVSKCFTGLFNLEQILIYKSQKNLVIYLLGDKKIKFDDSLFDRLIDINDSLQNQLGLVIQIELVIHQPVIDEFVNEALNDIQIMNFIKVQDYMKILTEANEFYKNIHKFNN